MDPNLPHTDLSSPSWEPLLKALPGIALALVGAGVRLLTSDKTFTVRQYCAGMSAAAFAGLLIAYLMADLAISPHIKMAVIGISGYTARDVLEALSSWFVKRLRKSVRDDGTTRSYGKSERDTVSVKAVGVSSDLYPALTTKKPHKTYDKTKHSSQVNITIHVDPHDRNVEGSVKNAVRGAIKGADDESEATVVLTRKTPATPNDP